jgi:type VII secretion protein EccE
VLQAAAVLLLITYGEGPLLTALAIVGAAALAALSWVRWRGRWLFEWLGVGLRYLSRRRTLAPEGDGGALLALVAPGTVVSTAEVAGDTAGVLADAYGLTAVLELGDPVGLLADPGQAVTSPADLLPAAGPDTPPVRLQLVVSAVPAPVARAGAATSATSYRQLTEGRLLGQERVLLAVRIQREEGWSDEHLRRALSGVVRKVRRRLGGIPARALGDAALLRTVVDVAHHDGRQPAREGWPAVHLGGMLHATFRLTRWPDARADLARRLVPRLLSLPAAATTVALTAGPRAGDDLPLDLVVRLVAADPGALTAAVQALDRLLGNDSAAVQRLDGEQLAGLSATMPLGGVDPGPVPGLAPVRPARGGPASGLELPVDAAGLMVGTNRHGAPVLARLFRAEPTRAMVIGGVRCAQLIAVRAMALGARVVVQTARPYAWEPFVRGVSTPGETIAVIPPGRPVPAAPGSSLYPLLVVVDVGPVAADGLTGGGWQANLVVRDELTTVDTDALGRVDLVVLQPLRPDEAALAGATLGLGDAAGWLTRIRPDMVGVVNRRTVRWALLSPTPIEQQLIGAPDRGRRSPAGRCPHGPHDMALFAPWASSSGWRSPPWRCGYPRWCSTASASTPTRSPARSAPWSPSQSSSGLSTRSSDR